MTVATMPETGSWVKQGRVCPLRIGAVVDSLLLPRWACRVLEAAEYTDFSELVMLIRLFAPGDRSPSLSSRDAALFRWWRQIDERAFSRRCARPDAFELVPFGASHSHPDIVELPYVTDSCSLGEASLNQIKAAHLDVILHLGSADPPPQLRDLPRLGVWSFGNAEEARARLFWTIFRGQPVIENELDVLSRGSNENRACRSYLAADRISFFRNYSNLCWKRSDALLHELSEVHDSDLRSVKERLPMQLRSGPNQRAPRSADVVRLAPRLLARTCGETLRKRLTRERWFVAFRKILNSEEIAGRTSFTVLWPPDGRFYADPFVIEREGKGYIFFEDYSYDQGKAVISFVELDGNGGCSEPAPALEEDCHLAYPFLFEYNGETYLLPETKNKRTIQLYRATSFPHSWKLAHVLMRDVAAADSSLLQCHGKFWLFTSGVGTADPWFDGDSELSLFFSDSLQGPWTAHPRNPVVADVRRSRGAGRLFFLGQHLIRPAQDSSTCYGHSVVLNRIEVLSEREYHEVPIGRIRPEWMPGNRGTHTLNHSANYEVLDGRTVISRYRLRPRPRMLQTLAICTQLLTRF
jgi:hypothetical protein